MVDKNKTKNRDDLVKAYGDALDRTVDSKRLLNKTLDDTKKEQEKHERARAEEAATKTEINQAKEQNMTSTAKYKSQYQGYKQDAAKLTEQFKGETEKLREIHGYDNFASGGGDLARYGFTLCKILNADMKAYSAKLKMQDAQQQAATLENDIRSAKDNRQWRQGVWEYAKNFVGSGLDAAGHGIDKATGHHLSGIRTSKVGLSADVLSVNPQTMVTVNADGTLKFKQFKTEYEKFVKKSEVRGLEALDKFFPDSIDLLLKRHLWEEHGGVYTKNGRVLDQAEFNKIAEEHLAAHVDNVMKHGIDPDPDPDPDLDMDDTPNPMHPPGPK